MENGALNWALQVDFRFILDSTYMGDHFGYDSYTEIRLDIGGIDVSNTEYIISEDTRDVSITCQMVPRTYPKSGSPVWRFVLNSMDDHGFRIVGNTIKFDSIQNNHNGNYTCCIGELSASVVIHVQGKFLSIDIAQSVGSVYRR